MKAIKSTYRICQIIFTIILLSQSKSAWANDDIKVNFNYFTQELEIVYKTKSYTKWGAVVHYTNLIEVYVNGTFIGKNDVEYSGFVAEDYEFSHTYPMPRYMKTLAIQVLEVEGKNIEKRTDKVVFVPFNLNDAQSSFTAYSQFITPNSCSVAGQVFERMTTAVRKTITEGELVDICARTEELITVQKDKGGFITLVSNYLPIDEMRYSIRNSKDPSVKSIRGEHVSGIRIPLPTKLNFSNKYNHVYPIYVESFFSSPSISAVSLGWSN